MSRITRARTAAVAVLAVALASFVSACGGEGEGAGAIEVLEVPSDCMQSWNGSPVALAFGRHVYSEHISQHARITVELTGSGAVNIKDDEACAVIFAVETNDEEYGDAGYVETKFGWASMRELSPRDQVPLFALQEEAARAPNAQLFPDGTISPS